MISLDVGDSNSLSVMLGLVLSWPLKTSQEVITGLCGSSSET